MIDLVALGETMLSLVAVGSLAGAETLVVTHGGAESNVCEGLVRLGRHAAWVGRLGVDPAGDRVAAALATAGVDLRWLRRDPDRPTGLMLRDTTGALRYERTGSAGGALSPEDLEGVPVEEARAVFVTGITALLGDAAGRAARALLERATGLRVVDPNLRRGLWGSERAAELIRPLIERADLVLGGEDELRAFADGGSGETLAGAIASLGPSEVVVRRGARGAGVLDPGEGWLETAPAGVPDVDPVGAGDAFTAGYLGARFDAASPAERLAAGARCGAAVAGSLGDTAGFPAQK
jgi:2-dehydro-3-deoxygluconokinase